MFHSFLRYRKEEEGGKSYLEGLIHSDNIVITIIIIIITVVLVLVGFHELFLLEG